jgi:hypothetical protein
MVFSQLPHFSSLVLTAIQRGAFGGLLPGYGGMGGRPAKRVARAAKSAKPEKPAKPEKLAKLASRKAFITDDSDDADDADDADYADDADDADDAARGKGKITALQSAVGRVCLRCSKRLHLAGESTSRGKTVPTGFRCDLSRYHKCSYCAHGHHDCEEVGWFPPSSRAC